MNTNLMTEFAVIDAEHRVRTKMQAEIDLLRILLRQARGERVSLHDKFDVQEILQRHPDFSETYKVPIRKKL